MTTSTAAPPTRPAQQAPAGTPAKPASLRQRRPTWAIWLGVLVIALGALGGAAVARMGKSTTSVVTVRAALTPGQKITQAQLGTIRLPDGTGLQTVPAANLDAVVGRYATVALPSGALLTPQSFSDSITPAAGKTVVGVGVKSSQMPALQLAGGDPVRVVVTVAGAGQNKGPGPGSSWPGTVVDQGPTNSSGVTTVDVLVDAAQATTIAAAAGGGNVAIVLDGK